MSKNDIELPPMPRWAVYQNVEDAVQAYARVAIEPYIETLFKIGEYLDIDYHAARTAPGKPSDIYIAAIKAAEQSVLKSPEIQALRKDAERYQYIRKGNQWIVAATQTGSHIDGEELDNLIDGDLEKQK